MMLAVRRIPLGDPEPRFEVEFAEEAIAEFAAHPRFEALAHEVRATLGADPFTPPGNRAKALAGHKPLRRYRPHEDNHARVLYVVVDDRVIILGLHPRRNDYRPKDLKAAKARLKRALAG